MTGWDAQLALSFARRGDASMLARKSHRGPLVVQKMLHPEGPGVCQAIVVHPPGGIAGGDRLNLDIALGRNAHAQLTTPGAAKWYRSAGATASQTIAAKVAAGATLEWLPQEMIVFAGARAELATEIALEGDATFIGWDIVSLGRAASGERFDRGRYRQRIELVRDGALLWAERTSLDAGDRVLASPAGLNGHPMFGTFVAAARSIAGDLLTACRSVAIDSTRGIEGAVTCLPGVLIARCRGASPEAARQWFAGLWQAVRPALVGRAAVPPRIWNT
jgi:urease accessory protein